MCLHLPATDRLSVLLNRKGRWLVVKSELEVGRKYEAVPCQDSVGGSFWAGGLGPSSALHPLFSHASYFYLQNLS